MHDSFRNTCKMFGILTCFGAILLAHQTMAQTPQSVQSFRSAYGALMDGYDQVFRQEGDARGQAMVAKAKSAMLMVKDADLARVLSKSGMPDVAPALAAIQRVSALSQQALSRKTIQSLPFPGAPTVIQACIDTPHGDQITYDALIAFQVTSGILSAAQFVCTEVVFGEDASLVCVPFAIANDIASSLFAVRSFCGGLDGSATVAGSYDRLDHIHTDLAGADTHLTNVNNQITSEFSALDTHLTNVDNHTAAQFSALDTHLTNVDNHTTAQFSALDAHLVALVTQLSNQVASLQALLSADLRQVMKLELTPEGLRQIAPAILTCTGANCPNVLANCPGGVCKWNSVGPLP
jgi:hypothetical protein